MARAGTIVRKRRVQAMRAGHHRVCRGRLIISCRIGDGRDQQMSTPSFTSRPEHVSIVTGDVLLAGTLHLPRPAHGLVVFAHGSGSSRHSPRNRYVADVLHRAGLATLLFDLLTSEEEAIDRVTAELRFDILFLAKRLLQVTRWVKQQAELSPLRLGYFGASTGAAAALVAAAQQPADVQAVVSRGGRPDLAQNYLSRVQAPTLLIVGGNDFVVIEMNRQAMKELRSENRLAIIPGATHLFEEKGAIEQVAQLARDWMTLHLA
jgi:putative phosphoribosyl transferase